MSVKGTTTAMNMEASGYEPDTSRGMQPPSRTAELPATASKDRLTRRISVLSTFDLGLFAKEIKKETITLIALIFLFCFKGNKRYISRAMDHLNSGQGVQVE